MGMISCRGSATLDGAPPSAVFLIRNSLFHAPLHTPLRKNHAQGYHKKRRAVQPHGALGASYA